MELKPKLADPRNGNKLIQSLKDVDGDLIRWLERMISQREGLEGEGNC